MQTRFILTIDSEEYEIQSEDLLNWEEIRCSYRRSDFGGVVRTFSSEFEFVNDARDLILEEFLSVGLSMQVSIAVYVMTDNWGHDKVFECPFDVATLHYDNVSLKISSVDNGLSSVLKARKSIKYDLKVGEDIRPDMVLHYDRLPLQEWVTYGFTQGEQSATSADILVSFNEDELPWVGSLKNEVSIGGKVFWATDQDAESMPYVLRVLKDTNLTLSYDFGWRKDKSVGGVILQVRVRRNGVMLETSQMGGTFAILDSVSMVKVELTESHQLPDPDDFEDREHKYAVYGGTVWLMKYHPNGYYWEDSGETEEEMFRAETSGTKELSLKSGDMVIIGSTFIDPIATSSVILFTRSEMKFSWINTGAPVDIDVVTPQRLLNTILRKITDGNDDVNGSISGYDERLKGTFMMSAQSLSGVEGALLSTTFSDFCDWMSAVFGYVYYIGEAKPKRFKQAVRNFAGLEGTPWAYTNEPWLGTVDEMKIRYFPSHKKFLYMEPSTSKIYGWWQTIDDYNDPETKIARTDTLFKNLSSEGDELLYFDTPIGDSLSPKVYDESVADVSENGKTVYFVHRSELFSADAETRVFESVRDIEYSIDESVIYSGVTIGYETQKYEESNGADEFNFNNTYTTGCTVTDKTLSLLSKYRADSYGIEFAVQKRGGTDSDSSKGSDVFFAHCKVENGVLVVSRDVEIGNAASDRLFNGVFSPMQCVSANSGFICVQQKGLTLTFTSSEANSDIVVGGYAMNGDITLTEQLATCGVLTFNTDEIDEIVGVNDLIEIESDGILYRGFLQEADVRYTRSEQTKYKIIVKEIEL